MDTESVVRVKFGFFVIKLWLNFKAVRLKGLSKSDFDRYAWVFFFNGKPVDWMTFHSRKIDFIIYFDTTIRNTINVWVFLWCFTKHEWNWCQDWLKMPFDPCEICINHFRKLSIDGFLSNFQRNLFYFYFYFYIDRRASESTLYSIKYPNRYIKFTTW